GNGEEIAFHDPRMVNSLRTIFSKKNLFTVTSPYGIGTALITLTENNNHIIVIPGANYNCTPKMVNKQLQLIKNADIILLQLEIPIDTVRLTIDLTDYYCIPVILNPAPAYPLSKDI